MNTVVVIAPDMIAKVHRIVLNDRQVKVSELTDIVDSGEKTKSVQFLSQNFGTILPQSKLFASFYNRR